MRALRITQSYVRLLHGHLTKGTSYPPQMGTPDPMSSLCHAQNRSVRAVVVFEC